ncbi:hypothetical protein B0H14DRAFT_2850007 [Mycena olivaceomarginata]|nr:hypothetical protein B0H14DRAFT_2850007 [Mycena olivaceomarginata]
MLNWSYRELAERLLDPDAVRNGVQNDRLDPGPRKLSALHRQRPAHTPSNLGGGWSTFFYPSRLPVSIYSAFSSCTAIPFYFTISWSFDLPRLTLPMLIARPSFRSLRTCIPRYTITGRTCRKIRGNTSKLVSRFYSFLTLLQCLSSQPRSYFSPSLSSLLFSSFSIMPARLPLPGTLYFL